MSETMLKPLGAELRVTVALGAALVVQTGLALIWAGGAAERIDQLERRIDNTDVVIVRTARLASRPSEGFALSGAAYACPEANPKLTASPVNWSAHSATARSFFGVNRIGSAVGSSSSIAIVAAGSGATIIVSAGSSCEADAVSSGATGKGR